MFDAVVREAWRCLKLVVGVALSGELSHPVSRSQVTADPEPEAFWEAKRRWTQLPGASSESTC